MCHAIIKNNNKENKFQFFIHQIVDQVEKEKLFQEMTSQTFDAFHQNELDEWLQMIGQFYHMLAELQEN